MFLVLDRVVVFDQIGHRRLAFFSPLKTDPRERVVQGVLLIEVTQQGQKWRVQNVAVKEKFEHAGCAVRGDDHDGQHPPRGGELGAPHAGRGEGEDGAESGKRQGDRDDKQCDRKLRLFFGPVMMIRHKIFG